MHLCRHDWPCDCDGEDTWHADTVQDCRCDCEACETCGGIMSCLCDEELPDPRQDEMRWKGDTHAHDPDHHCL
jgi:hypothetical protein